MAERPVQPRLGAAGGVQADHAHGAGVNTLDGSVPDVSFIAGPGLEKTQSQIVDRGVMIAGDGENPAFQRAQKAAGFLEFTPSAALGEVTGDNDQIGLFRVNGLLQPRQRPFIGTAEMKVRNVNDLDHGRVTHEIKNGSAIY